MMEVRVTTEPPRARRAHTLASASELGSDNNRLRVDDLMSCPGRRNKPR